jgi:nitrate reductase gamma subunit
MNSEELMSLLQVFAYLSLIFIIVGTIYRAVKLAGMPLHLRWDLYPIPHEKGREQYGGSYFEEIDWWTKPTNSSTANELKEMGKEIFLIQSLFHNNRPLWIFSFPFHGGLYLLIGYLVFLVVGGILQAVGTQVSSSGSAIGAFVYYATVALGKIGFILGVVGACGLFLTRIFNSNVRKMSARADYFNLILLMAVFVTGIISFVKVDPEFSIARGFTVSLLTLSAAPPLPAETAVHEWLAGVFFVYLPFTHMMHFVGKYFTYHKVRWEDHPNIRGSKIEETISKALGYKIQWSAEHIKTGSTWAEAATDVPTREDRQ